MKWIGSTDQYEIRIVPSMSDQVWFSVDVEYLKQMGADVREIRIKHGVS